MRAAGNGADLLAGKLGRVGGRGRIGGLRREMSERAIEGPRGFRLRQGLRIDPQSGDDDIAFIARQRWQKLGKGQHPDLAARAQFRAHGIGQFDIEPGQAIGFITVMEGREAVIDENADCAADRLGLQGFGIDEAEQRHGIARRGRLRRRGPDAQRECQDRSSRARKTAHLLQSVHSLCAIADSS